MTVQWEVEHPGLRLDDNQAAWNVRNVGDETAAAGSEIGTVAISRRPNPGGTIVSESTFTNPLTIDRDVEARTSDALTYPLTWDGQEPGLYTIGVSLGEVYAELHYQVDRFGNAEFDFY